MAAKGQKLLGTTLTGALAVETIGAIDPFGGKTFLPSPRRYAATWVVWFVLGMIAAGGGKAADMAGQFSVLVLTTMIFVGPFGKKAITFFRGVASGVSSVPETAPPAPPPGNAHKPGPQPQGRPARPS